LLQEEGFVLDLKSHMNFTVVTEEMFDDYQAVIVDVRIPCSGGFELLRDIPNNTCVPVLVLTALGDEENRVVGLEPLGRVC
jgi:DNA-binding response OmpR family regulator